LAWLEVWPIHIGLFFEFRDLWSVGSAIRCGYMHQSFTDALVLSLSIAGSRRCRYTYADTDVISSYNIYASWSSALMWRKLCEMFVVTSLSLVKAKFHYASWFEAGSKLVTDRFEAGLRTSFKPASVMEFGFKIAIISTVFLNQLIHFYSNNATVFHHLTSHSTPRCPTT